MDAVDEALRRSREDRLAASLAVWKFRADRKRRDRVERMDRRKAGLRLRHRAKLARCMGVESQLPFGDPA